MEGALGVVAFYMASNPQSFVFSSVTPRPHLPSSLHFISRYRTIFKISMEDEGLFCSSDVEFSPPQVKRFQHAGAASITSMRESLFEDRISSKKRVRQLTDNRGAPSTLYVRQLWRNRFQNYVDAHKVR